MNLVRGFELNTQSKEDKNETKKPLQNITTNMEQVKEESFTETSNSQI
jgi:hypothetical protein